MIYEFIERLEDLFEVIIHYFRAMFCKYYSLDTCKIGHKCACRYYFCPKRKGMKK